MREVERERAREATICNRDANSNGKLVPWLDILCQSCIGNPVEIQYVA